MSEAVDRTEDMEREFSKSPGGNYFNYVDTAKLERMGITQYKPSLGENAVRIVFPPTRKGFYGLEIYKHSNVGSNRKTFICKKRMEIGDHKCPVCDYADSLRSEDPQDERAKELRSSRRYLFFVVEVQNDDAIDKGIRWWDCPVGIFGEIKSRSKARRRRGQDEGEHKKFIDVSHPSEGRDIVFEQVKEKGKYSYQGVDLVEADPIPEDWYSDLPEFMDILKDSSNEEMEEACKGEATPDEVEEKGEDTEKAESKDDKDGANVVEDEAEKPEEKEEKPSGRTTSRRSLNRKSQESQEKESDLKQKIKDRIDQAKKARQSEGE